MSESKYNFSSVFRIVHKVDVIGLGKNQKRVFFPFHEKLSLGFFWYRDLIKKFSLFCPRTTRTCVAYHHHNQLRANAAIIKRACSQNITTDCMTSFLVYLAWSNCSERCKKSGLCNHKRELCWDKLAGDCGRKYRVKAKYSWEAQTRKTRLKISKIYEGGQRDLFLFLRNREGHCEISWRFHILVVITSVNHELFDILLDFWDEFSPNRPPVLELAFSS